ncbi:MAG: ATP-dependent zinc protease [Nitrospiraceae bacterium]|nr:MAG: ATP-dependent zinc protease [Nitrospiraceae bacterium]
MKKKKSQDKQIIGWREYVHFPEWGVRNVRAKVDTGARTSSLHVDDIVLLKNNRIRFYVVLCGRDPLKRKKVVARRLRKGRVRSSTGAKTERWYVKAKVSLGDVQRDIVINLIDRGGMNFRMLLGRTAIDDSFLVDVDRSFLLGKKRKVVCR